MKEKFIHLFIEPRMIDEDDKRREFILNVIICAFLSLFFFLSSIFIYNTTDYSLEYKILSLLILLLIWTTFSSLLFLSRKGHVKTASYSLIGLITLFSTSGALEWGFDLPAVIVSYLLIIVISCILFDSRLGIAITFILSLMICIIGYYQIKINPPELSWRPEGPEIIDTIIYSIELCFIMAISWLSNHELNRSLSRARISEERLSNELERISRVHHFAEFGKLSSGAFHDLMNPLTSIYLNISGLQNSLHPELEETKQSLEIAVKASQRMQNFIEALEKQMRHKAIVGPFIINKEIQQAIDLTSYKARREKCRVIFTSNKNISSYGDSLALYQTITNLISNAIDSCERCEQKNKVIKIILIEKVENILIEIKDKGNGIPPEEINKIFDPFFTTKAFDKGFGLGLSNSKERIEKELNATISVSSELNRGTTFTISIPKRLTQKIAVIR